MNYNRYLESSLHTLLVALLGKPLASFQVVKNLSIKIKHNIYSKPVYSAARASNV